MQPTSATRALAKAGFTLLEMLIVLVIMAVATALALPMIAGALDRASAQVAMFDFQRQMLDLRAQAWRSETPILVQANDPPAATDIEPRPLKIALTNGWTYSLSSAIAVNTQGGCSLARVDLIKSGARRLSLQNVAGDCHFQRS